MWLVLCGQGSTMANQKVIDKVIELSGNQQPHVAYLGTPSKDREEVFQAIAIPYKECGCRITRLDLWKESTDVNDHVATILHQVDIILISGGCKSRAMRKWAALGVDQLLKDTAARPNPPVFVGGSAGALCLAHSGLGLVPVALVPHYDELDTHPLVVRPEKILKRHPGKICIGIDALACWIIHGDETVCFSADGIALCHHVHRDGEMIQSSNIPFDCIIPFSSFGVASHGAISCDTGSSSAL